MKKDVDLRNPKPKHTGMNGFNLRKNSKFQNISPIEFFRGVIWNPLESSLGLKWAKFSLKHGKLNWTALSRPTKQALSG